MNAANPRAEQFPVGASITREQLETRPYDAFDLLRKHEPVSWLPAYGGWFITRHDLAVETMRDAGAFTVDDPRFTTAAILGPSMLSIDGPEHQTYRAPYSANFRPRTVEKNIGSQLTSEAQRLVTSFASAEGAELRTQLAGPMAVNSILAFMGIGDLASDNVLRWYGSITAAITGLTLGQPMGEEAQSAVDEMRAAIDRAGLRPDAIVILFGGIETVEGMIANALWHLLTADDAWARVLADRDLIPHAIEESLRLEPAASLVDRYATEPIQIGGASIDAGDLVTISLLGANRDPAVFHEPHTFTLDRHDANKHVTFASGPHACIGAHLARMETAAAIGALMDALPHIEIDPDSSAPPSGLIFRKPAAITVNW